MHPVTTLLAAVVNRALNGELTRFAAQHIALRAGAQRFVFRIGAQGKLAPASPLIDADCCIEWRGGGLHISGGGELFAALSAVQRQTDWLAVASGLFGLRLAPLVLHRLESMAAGVGDWVAGNAAAPPAAAAHGRQVENLHSRVLQLGRRIDALAARAAAPGG